MFNRKILTIVVMVAIIITTITTYALAQTPTPDEQLIETFMNLRGFDTDPARRTRVASVWLTRIATVRPTLQAFLTEVALTGTPTPRATSTPTRAATATRRPGEKVSSYAPVQEEEFSAVLGRMILEKMDVEKAHQDLLNERYDLSDQPVPGLMMSGGRRAVQGGVRVKLPAGQTWQSLSNMTPAQIKQSNLFPAGFMPLPFPNHNEGGMLFPKFHINEVRGQTLRDLTRFDLDFQMPDRFLPEFPPPIFLTTRLDLGDVSKGELVTTQNFYELFNGILNPKQLEGLRLLVEPVPQQQFNRTADRRTIEPSAGVSCFDCHANGHTNAATHISGDTRPLSHRRRVDTPTLRGVNIQRLFGSQRALKTVEDFTEFEQRAAYFDGDPVIATKKGVNILERGSETQFMSEFQELLSFPPAPKLDVFGMLDPALATAQEIRGQEVFFGKGKCSTCHVAPYYTDNLMHDLMTERFYNETMINGRLASNDGPIKTFSLRGVKDSPPYLHDGRLLTLDDTVEFFNLVLQLKLTDQEKQDLVAFLRQL